MHGRIYQAMRPPAHDERSQKPAPRLFAGREVRVVRQKVLHNGDGQRGRNRRHHGSAAEHGIWVRALGDRRVKAVRPAPPQRSGNTAYPAVVMPCPRERSSAFQLKVRGGGEEGAGRQGDRIRLDAVPHRTVAVQGCPHPVLV